MREGLHSARDTAILEEDNESPSSGCEAGSNHSPLQLARKDISFNVQQDTSIVVEESPTRLLLPHCQSSQNSDGKTGGKLAGSYYSVPTREPQIDQRLFGNLNVGASLNIVGSEIDRLKITGQPGSFADDDIIN